MFKRGDKVQFSKYGSRGLKGYVREVRSGSVLVEWVNRQTSWVYPSELVKLPEPTLGSEVQELVRISREIGW